MNNLAFKFVFKCLDGEVVKHTSILKVGDVWTTGGLVTITLIPRMGEWTTVWSNVQKYHQRFGD